MMDEKAIKAIAEKIAENAYSMAKVIAKGDRVETGPGPNGTVKITRVRREFIKTGREKERPES